MNFSCGNKKHLSWWQRYANIMHCTTIWGRPEKEQSQQMETWIHSY